jgi:group I intron endonuclease
MIFTIYLITNKLNGKVYVGQTHVGLKSRWKSHRDYARRGSKYPICKAIRKYGPESFTIQEIASCDSQEWADYLERVWILLYDSRNRKKGYNVREGGNTSPMAGSTREKLSKATKLAWAEGRIHSYSHTEETKKKISESQRAGRFHNHPVTSEELVFLWNSHVLVHELANHFSLTTTTIYERIKNSGLPFREFSCSKNRSKDNHPRNLPFDVEAAWKLRETGMSYDKIGRQMGYTPTLVSRRLKKHKESNP